MDSKELTPVSVVMATDHAYAMPLAVAVRSILENLSSAAVLHLYVLADGIPEDMKRRMAQSWQPFPLRLTWISPDTNRLRGKVSTRGYAGVMACYFRLLAGEVLPRELQKVIYLDADVCVLGDLLTLWNKNMQGKILLAAPDPYADTFHTPRLARAAVRETVRFTGKGDYFNAGVLVIDLKRWREENIGKKALELLFNYRDELAFRDQDALNYVANNHWGPLNPAWNFLEMHFGYFGWEGHGCTETELREAFTSPQIVHFASPVKPWDPLCPLYFADRFMGYLRRTSWKDWRPPPASPIRRLFFHLITFPNSRLDWYFWRGMVQMRDAQYISKFIKLMIARPWAMITFPLWQLGSWFLLKTMDRKNVKEMKAFLRRLIRLRNPTI
ncbi:MAG: glycosyltransferase family 8 protein [Deltaproteobacteria bacterium]|nr:glycosyltransferase family 8 protein [Deltaproteobacteria bacterium]MBW2285119.1 glycosyltransferase family 8 protein [Deltaproteobacteria bacterium]